MKRYEVFVNTREARLEARRKDPNIVIPDSEFSGQKAIEDFTNNYYWGFLDYALGAMHSSSRKFISPRNLTFCCKYVMNCLQVRTSEQKMIQQNCLNMIMMEMCLPLLCQNDHDRHLWEQEPTQYIYSVSHVTEDHNMVKNSVKELLQKICLIEVDKKRVYLREYITKICERLTALTGNDENSIIQKECLLHGIETVVDQFMTDREIRNSLPGLLANQLLPVLRQDDKFGILAFRVCSLYSRIGYFIKFDPDVHITFCQLICQALVRGPIPTQIKAAEALSVLVEFQVELKGLLSNELEFIIKTLLQMIDKFDFDGLVESLKVIIKSFDQEIGPHSAKVFDGLKVAYYGYKSNLNTYKGSEDKENEISELDAAADACILAMNNLIHSNLLPEVYFEISKPVIELLNLCILEEDEINFPICLSMLNKLLSKTSKLTDSLVAYFPVLCYIVIGKPNKDYQHNPSLLADEQFEAVVAKVNKKDHILDEIHILTACLENFTLKLGEDISQNRDFYGTKFVDLYYQVMDGIGAVCKEGDSGELVWPLKMGMALLENLNPVNHIEPVLQMVDQILARNNLPSRVISSGISVFSVAFVTNLTSTLQILNSKYGNKNYVQKWFQEVGNSKSASMNNKIYFIRALLSFLDANANSLPQGLNLQLVWAAFIDLSEDLIQCRLEENDPDYEASDDEDEDGDHDFLYDDEDVSWDEDADFEEEEECHYYSRMLNGCPIIERFKENGYPDLGPNGHLLSESQAATLKTTIEKARRVQQLTDEKNSYSKKLASGIKQFN